MEKIALFHGLAAILMWSASPLFNSYLINVPLDMIVLVTFGLAFISFLIFNPSSFYKSIKQADRLGLIIFTCCVYFNQVFYIKAFRFLPAEYVELTYYLWPLMLIIILSLSKIARFQSYHFIGVILCILSIPVLSSSPTIVVDFNFLKGISYALISALAWAIYNSTARVIKVGDSLSLVYLICFLISLSSFNKWNDIAMLKNPDAFLPLLALGCGILFLSVRMWSYAIHHGCLKTLSLLPYMVPTISISLLVLCKKTSFSYNLIFSTLLLSIGALVAAYPSIKQKIKTSQVG